MVSWACGLLIQVGFNINHFVGTSWKWSSYRGGLLGRFPCVGKTVASDESTTPWGLWTHSQMCDLVKGYGACNVLWRWAVYCLSTGDVSDRSLRPTTLSDTIGSRSTSGLRQSTFRDKRVQPRVHNPRGYPCTPRWRHHILRRAPTLNDEWTAHRNAVDGRALHEKHSNYHDKFMDLNSWKKLVVSRYVQKRKTLSGGAS